MAQFGLKGAAFAPDMLRNQIGGPSLDQARPAPQDGKLRRGPEPTAAPGGRLMYEAMEKEGRARRAGRGAELSESESQALGKRFHADLQQLSALRNLLDYVSV